MKNWTPRSMPSQEGRLAIVTGANSGVGYQAARHLAHAGATVILACRNMQKGAAAQARLVARNPAGRAELAMLDLSDLESVRRFAQEFLAGGRPLDLLLNNAGVMALPERESTSQGFEMQFGTNHLGHFALTGLLLPAMLRRAGSRIVTVSSIAHKGGRLNFEDLNWARGYNPRAAYQQSKLANLVFALELDRRLRAHSAAAASMGAHPGVALTNIIHNGMGTRGLRARLTRLVFPLVGQSDDRGSWPLLYAATSPDAHGGGYYGPGGLAELRGSPVEVKPHPRALDAEAARRLWAASEELTGVVYGALAD